MNQAMRVDTAGVSGGSVAGERSRVMRRIAGVDIVRGAVMVLMALDHVRDWVTTHRFPPEDLSRSWTALFLTRWVTHFCAPTFFLLSGVGIGILMSRGTRRSEMSRLLLTRGVWLLTLELVITPIGWQFGVQLIPAFALVLWALGWS
ncbi:MAG TPA: heparan-alpha-glucosaminide N-acetyltransferase domain-containing protein, partial [Longimicrobiales bacterium]|nr:heparan-alpha-glucosaminide N-acetyltransferase domain-containing protein [Longimicrobiales bacterium]